MTQRSWTWDELEREVTEEKAPFAVIHGKVYDLSQDFLRWHPGGSVAATQVSHPCRE
jgi:cytochrome b involved in lipid metabolism